MYFVYINIKIRSIFVKKIKLINNWSEKERKNAYSWLKSSLSKTLVRAEQEGDYQLYYTKSATAGDLTLNKSFILKYKSQLKNPNNTDFDLSTDFEFVLGKLRIHKDANASNWMENLIQCNCPFFQKKFFCKHSMGLAVLQNLATVPSNAKYDV